MAGQNELNIKKSRKIMFVKHSKYESNEQIHENKKYWEKVFSAMEEPSTIPLESLDSRRLSDVLPIDLYIKVCSTLDIPTTPRSRGDSPVSEEKEVRRLIKDPLLSFRQTLHVDRELDSDTDVELSPRKQVKTSWDEHQQLLRKPEREQFVWPSRYLQPEQEDEKTLIRKAEDLTDRIATEFCDYMRQLGGNQHSKLFTPEAVKELFQIEFDKHVARSLKVVPRELPTINDKVASVTGNHNKARSAALERQIIKDIKAESRPDKIMAFGRYLERNQQQHLPRNNTKEAWQSTKYVPKDLVTLKTVWEGITNLRSVKEYCRWMIKHPEYKRAPYLSSLGMFDTAVLGARLTVESLHGNISPPGMEPMEQAGLLQKDPEAVTLAPKYKSDNEPVLDHIRRRLSNIADS